FGGLAGLFPYSAQNIDAPFERVERCPVRRSFAPGARGGHDRPNRETQQQKRQTAQTGQELCHCFFLEPRSRSYQQRPSLWGVERRTRYPSPAKEAFIVLYEEDVVLLQHRHQHILELGLPEFPFVELRFHRLAGSEIGETANEKECVGIF